MKYLLNRHEGLGLMFGMVIHAYNSSMQKVKDPMFKVTLEYTVGSMPVWNR